MSEKVSLYSIIIFPQNKMEKMSHKHVLALTERDSTENNLQNALAIEREAVANLQNEVAQLKVRESTCVCVRAFVCVGVGVGVGVGVWVCGVCVCGCMWVCGGCLWVGGCECDSD